MYKVGDKVKIKDYDEIKEIIENYNHGPGFAEKMKGYCNKLAKIISVDNRDLEWFHLDIDRNKWIWDARWLEKSNIIQLNSDLFEL